MKIFIIMLFVVVIVQIIINMIYYKFGIKKQLENNYVYFDHFQLFNKDFVMFMYFENCITNEKVFKIKSTVGESKFLILSHAKGQLKHIFYESFFNGEDTFLKFTFIFDKDNIISHINYSKMEWEKNYENIKYHEDTKHTLVPENPLTIH